MYFAVACALAAPSTGAAREPAQLDPDSPAGVEYELPLDQARRDAAPDAGGGAGGGGPGAGPRSGSEGPAPLFGTGITRKASPSGGGQATADEAERRRQVVKSPERASGDSGDPGAAGAGGEDAACPRAGDSAPCLGSTAATDGGSSTDLILGGIALAVVVTGGVLGLALRRGLKTAPAK